MSIVTLNEVSVELRKKLSAKSGVPVAQISNLTSLFKPPLNFSPNSSVLPTIIESTAEALLGPIWYQASATRKITPSIPPYVLFLEKKMEVWIDQIALLACLDIIGFTLGISPVAFNQPLNFSGITSVLNFPPALQGQVNSYLGITTFSFSGGEVTKLRAVVTAEDACDVLIPAIKPFL